MPPRLPDNPPQIVFSGGGLRCFWQGGFMTELCRHRTMTPERVSGVSGGALAGSAFLAGCEQKLLDEMCAAFEAQESNVSLFERAESGLTPHQEIYSDVVRRVLDRDAMHSVAGAARFQILIAHPPAEGLPPELSGTAMTAAYEAELHTVGSPHFDWAEKIGLETERVDANAAAREGRLAELVEAAATIPPIFDPPDWNGRPVVDAGMADQAPMPDPDEGHTLILLTRSYDRVPDHPRRTYIAPSRETPADKIDFTDPKKLRATWAQGESDARALLDARKDS
jgi:predicted acylesterase/phospholipase RssA